MREYKNAITDVPGIQVGQAQDDQALTGCTVVMCRKGAVGGVDVRGSAPGTRETDLLDPINLVEKVHAVLLSGGSAFGLDAASGVMRYLDEQRIGYKLGGINVPIVPAAILFDLKPGQMRRPDLEMGYAAASAANSGPVAEGSFGAGTGASVGKIFGSAGAMKSGLGTASLNIGGGIVVGAIAAVNAFGDVVDPATGQIVAGARPVKLGPVKLGRKGELFADTMKVMKTATGRAIMNFATKSNTAIGVVAANVKFTKAEATKMAQMAQDGIARAIRPAHTMLDGDTIFALATGAKRADVSIVGAYAAEVMAQAIVRAVQMARAVSG